MSNPNNQKQQQSQAQAKSQQQQPKAPTQQDNLQATQQDSPQDSQQDNQSNHQQQATQQDNLQATQQDSPQPVATPIEQAKEVPVQQPVSVPVPNRRPVTISTPLPVGAGELSVDELVARARADGDSNTVYLAERLDAAAANLGRRKSINPDEAAKVMEGLYGTLLNVLNIDKSRTEFNTQWELVIKKFKQHSADGFGGHRIYRGVGYWSKGQEAYVHFQALVNLINLSSTEKRESLYKMVNFNALIKPGTSLSPAGASRLVGYYT